MDSRVRFLLRANGCALFLTNEGATWAFEGDAGGAALRMKLVGGSDRVQAEGLEELSTRSNYFKARDPAGWVTNVPHYARVLYRNVYPRVDLVFHGSGGRLEYDWVIAPGARPEAIRVAFEGDDALNVDARSGELVARAKGFELRHHQPVAYEERDGLRKQVAASYRLIPGGEMGFHVGSYDPAGRLMIDPVLTYSTLLGGSGVEVPPHGGIPAMRSIDFATGLAVDTGGNAYIIGSSVSPDFPSINSGLVPGQRGPDNSNTFVAKLDPKGSIVYVSFLPGSLPGAGNAIAVDAQGAAYVTGSTSAAPDFPVVNALQRTPGGGGDAFIAKLNPGGSALVYSTFLGGSGYDAATSIAVDAGGNAYVTGVTASSNFPVTAGAAQPAQRGSSGGFVAKISSNGASLAYSTYLGGARPDPGPAIAIDAAGNAFVGGSAEAGLATTQGVVQPACAGPPQTATVACQDGFVAKLNASGSALLYATYLGGNARDIIRGIAIDSVGNAYLAGLTNSITTFPTIMGAFQPSARAGPSKAFIMKLNPTGSALVYSTFLGGTDNDAATGIAIDSTGNAYVTGYTNSSDFPLARPLQAACSPQATPIARGLGLDAVCTEAFLAKLNPEGSGLIYSTYLGGSDIDGGNAVAVSGSSVYVLGTTLSPDFPVTAATLFPRGTVFVARITEGADAPVFTAASLTNGASFVSGLTPGGIGTIFGAALTSTTGIVLADSLPLPTQLAGTIVTVNGIRAPLLGVAKVDGREQINFVAPYQIAGQITVPVVVVNNGISSLPVRVPVLPAQPGVFTADGMHAIAQHSADFTLVSASNPAQPGEVVILYTTGLGPVQPPVATGNPAPASPLARTVASPLVLVGGNPAEMLFSGLTPGFAGLYQINARIPQDARSGDLDVAVKVGDQSSKVVKLPVQ